ncbi:hypothetical protein HGM15179_006966 [Zosterops borbonicus]|uniref:Uncharacterized protein n=1 Tax=Zosterops borbonicus TaxID=364589 RepID=A0A8K1LNJ4_9PASS|nr:hypothetical protein HGM15179_006966 [Zosterops borbonicus]
MEADFAAFGSPLCGEVKRFCRRVRETYREIQEELTPYKDDRYYRKFNMNETNMALCKLTRVQFRISRFGQCKQHHS